MTDEAEFEVVRGPADGWGVRRKGEPQALSHHETREQAEEAARMQSGEGVEVDVRRDVAAGEPELAVDAKRTFTGFMIMLIGVFLLIAIVAVIVVVTGVTS